MKQSTAEIANECNPVKSDERVIIKRIVEVVMDKPQNNINANNNDAENDCPVDFEKIVSGLFNKLMDNARENYADEDIPVIERAFDVAYEAHKEQRRRSGEPYVIHPLSVALILSEMEMGSAVIAAALLHDVVEDTDVTRDELRSMFGREIADLVDGVTKLSGFDFTSAEDKQAENLRKMFIAMSSDIRVLPIKIADRLHNMRTLQFQKPERQKPIAQETLEIYCPLADRLGISRLRAELEDLSFKYLFPEDYRAIAKDIRIKQSARENYVRGLVDELKRVFTEHDVDAYVEGRPKHLYSIYRKMLDGNKSIDEIYDLFAVRAIVRESMDCYAALGAAHETFTPIPQRLKDYIAMPKSNMYQSIHTTLIGPDGHPFELQIRTWEMHRACEFGIAAHWRYKDKTGKINKGMEEKRLQWIQQILDWQREFLDNKEYLENLKFDLSIYRDTIFCFTPKGAVITLPAGATCIDFAYAIHSGVGDRMVGAKIDGKIVPIDTVINSGDRVDIMTRAGASPSLDWTKMVKTPSAKAKINQWFKKRDRETNIEKGREMLEKAAARKNLSLGEIMTPAAVAAVLKKQALSEWDGLVAAVGHGGIQETTVINRLQEEYLLSQGTSLEKERMLKQIEELTSQKPEGVKQEENFHRELRGKRSGIMVKGVGDMNVKLSRCCSPVPGDDIIGYITRGRGVTIHRKDCTNMESLPEDDKNRLIDCQWEIPEGKHENYSFRADLRIEAINEQGILMQVTQVFNDEKIEVKAFNVRSQNDRAIFTASIDIRGKEQLQKVMDKLTNLARIYSVARITV